MQFIINNQLSLKKYNICCGLLDIEVYNLLWFALYVVILVL